MVVESREVAIGLREVGVLDGAQELILRTLAGYRNRLVHFYQEVSDRELYEICAGQLGDVEGLLGAVLAWIEAHPEKIDRGL